MARTITTGFRTEMEKQVNDPVNLYVIKYDPDDDTTWERYAESPDAISFDGKTYAASAITREDIEATKDGSLIETRLTIPDVNGGVWASVLQARTNGTLKKAEILIMTVFRSRLNEPTSYIEDEFNVVGASKNQYAVELSLRDPLAFEDTLPRDRYTKTHCRHPFVNDGSGRCKYSGADTTCERTLTACQDKNNQVNFGGFPVMKRVRGVSHA